MKVLDDPDRLLADAQDGNPDWTAIYLLVRPSMHAAVRRILRPYRSYGGVCEHDVVTKAFEELMRKNLHDVKSLKAIASTIAHRRAQDVVRKPCRELPFDPAGDRLDDAELAEVLEEREHLFETVQTALDALPERQRVAIRETVMNGRSCKDLACQLGITHQAVSKQRNNGLRRLRLALHYEAPPDEETD